MSLGKQTAQALPGVDHAPSEAVTTEPSAAPTKFRDMSIDERQWELHQRGLLGHRPHITNFFLSLLSEAEETIENAIGYVGVPLGMLPSVLVNGKEYIVPMATEERSVIASAAKAAKMCLPTGGVTVQASIRPRVPVQIMYVAPPQPRSFQRRLFELSADIEGAANDHGGHMEKRGGTPVRAGQAYLLGGGDYVVLPMEVDTCDAMGANMVTRVAEKVAAFLHEKCGMPRHGAVICSNDESGWRVSASAVWPTTSLSQRERMLHVARWASLDMTRAVTHNKGIMNGISAVALATGQDTRAIEACAHASALRHGDYSPLSQFGLCDTLDGHSAIGGSLTLHIPCGTAGGATQRPFFKECLELMGNPSARQLASVMAAVGLLQNFAALWSLAGEGIPASHERLKK